MLQLLQTLKSKTWMLIPGLFVAIVLLFPTEFASADAAKAASDALKTILFAIIMNLTGWFLAMGGILLDYGVNTFVINFGLIFNTGGVGVAVNELWVLVRDLFNILFIFGLVYIGFQMILNSDDSRTRSTLVSLIMAALLINFSLFITKFVVDFTNTLATEIAVAGFDLVNDGAEGEDAVVGGGNARSQVEIGNTFFRLMGATKFLEVPTNVQTGEGAPWSYIFGLGIINIVGAFAFGVGGIMLIIRFVVLSIYMVLSPFMFLGFIFPGLAGMSSKYWTGFLKQAFYAPVYIVMIFFSATILNNFFGAGGSSVGAGIGTLSQNSNIFSPDGGNVTDLATNFGGGLGPFILSAAFLIAAVQVAGKLASDGSAQMAKVSGAVNARVRGAVRRPLNAYGAAGMGGARAAGRGAGGMGARYVNRAAERRRTQLNTLTGEWSQGGRFKKTAARVMDRTVGAGYDRLADTKVLGSETQKERTARIEGKQDEFNKADQATKRADDIKAYVEDPTNEDKKNKAAGAVAKSSEAELNNMTFKKGQDPTLVTKLMSSPQVKALVESGKMNNKEAKDMKTARENAIFKPLEAILNDEKSTVEQLEKAAKDMADAMKNMSKEQKSEIDFDRLNTQAVASNLSDKDIDNLRESGKLSTTQVDQVKRTRSTGIANLANYGRTAHQVKNETTGKLEDVGMPRAIKGDPAEVKAFVKKQREKTIKGNSEAIGQLAIDAFMAGDTMVLPAAKEMTVDVLKAIARAADKGKSGMTQDDRQKLANAIVKSTPSSSQLSTYLNSAKGKEAFGEIMADEPAADTPAAEPAPALLDQFGNRIN